jgi:D-sedoheptulose 7-phosphate isomerase
MSINNSRANNVEAQTMNTDFSEVYFNIIKELLDSFPHEQFEKAAQILLEAYQNDRMIFVMGNGGSGATASHFACDMNKETCASMTKKFKIMCLNDNVPSLLAYANDVSYQDVFVAQLKNFIQPDDVVMGISTSGNSTNIIKAIRHAAESSAKTIALCGYNGGTLSNLVDAPIVIQNNNMQAVEDIHLIVVHLLMRTLNRTLEDTPSCQ